MFITRNEQGNAGWIEFLIVDVVKLFVSNNQIEFPIRSLLRKSNAHRKYNRGTNYQDNFAETKDTVQCSAGVKSLGFLELVEINKIPSPFKNEAEVYFISIGTDNVKSINSQNCSNFRMTGSMYREKMNERKKYIYFIENYAISILS